MISLKLLTFSLANKKPRIGGLTKTGYVIDLQKCLRKCLTDIEEIERGQEIASALIPNDMTEFIRGGSRSLEAAKLALEYGSQRQQEFIDAGILVPESKITFWPPVTKPGKIICAVENFLKDVLCESLFYP